MMNPFLIPNERIWAQIQELCCLLPANIQFLPLDSTGEKEAERKKGSDAEIMKGHV